MSPTPFDPAQLQVVMDELTHALDVARWLSENLDGPSADQLAFDLHRAIALAVLAVQNLQRVRDI